MTTNILLYVTAKNITALYNEEDEEHSELCIQNFCVGDIIYDFLNDIQSSFLEAGLPLGPYTHVYSFHNIQENKAAIKALDAVNYGYPLWKDYSGTIRYRMYQLLEMSFMRQKAEAKFEHASSHVPREHVKGHRAPAPKYQTDTLDTFILGAPGPDLYNESKSTYGDVFGLMDCVQRLSFSVKYISPHGEFTTEYRINTLQDLLAVDFMLLFSTNGAKRINFCKHCGKVYRSTRSDSLFCSKRCVLEAQKNDWNEYRVKYRYRRKCISEYITGKDYAPDSQEDIDLKARSKWWREICRSQLHTIESFTYEMTPEEYAAYLKKTWEKCLTADELPIGFQPKSKKRPHQKQTTREVKKKRSNV